MASKLDSILLPVKDTPQAKFLAHFSEPNGVLRCKVLDISHPYYIRLLVAFRDDKAHQIEVSVPHFAVAWILTGVSNTKIGFLVEPEKKSRG